MSCIFGKGNRIWKPFSAFGPDGRVEDKGLLNSEHGGVKKKFKRTCPSNGRGKE